MTLYDFAWLPKRCDKCGRKFIWERYYGYTKCVGLECYDLKCVKCKVCKRLEGVTIPPMPKKEEVIEFTDEDRKILYRLHLEQKKTLDDGK